MAMALPSQPWEFHHEAHQYLWPGLITQSYMMWQLLTWDPPAAVHWISTCPSNRPWTCGCMRKYWCAYVYIIYLYLYMDVLPLHLFHLFIYSSIYLSIYLFISLFIVRYIGTGHNEKYLGQQR